MPQRSIRRADRSAALDLVMPSRARWRRLEDFIAAPANRVAYAAALSLSTILSKP